MFTGLVEFTGKVESITLPSNDDKSICVLTLKTGPYEAKIGDSIAVNGCCLTITKRYQESTEFEISRETLECTNLSELKAGELVNLERAMLLSDRLGGHLVSGHVESTGTVRRFDEHPQGRLLEIELNLNLAPLVIPKGSVAINGISLTINEVEDLEKSVIIRMMIIPETIRKTNIGTLNKGNKVNIEPDQIAKFVLRQNSLLRHPTYK